VNAPAGAGRTGATAFLEDDPALYRRKTAADRPGVAQPVPLRPVPAQPWTQIFVTALVLFVLLVGGWEWYWRDFGATPGIRNSDGLWAIQRRRIDNGEGDATVIVASSRLFFDLQLDIWQKLDGRRPIQLAWEGTTPVPFLEDLAADPKFTGRVLVGVAPELFFSGWGGHKKAIKYARDESPSQRIGQWLSMHLVEPYFAFYDPDFALAAVIKRQPWPDRPGKPSNLDVRKLSVTEADRNTHMWSKVETDPAYRTLMRRIWEQDFKPSDDDPTPEELAKMCDEQIDKAVKAVTKLRERGVKVLFVREPSIGPYLAFDNRLFPRATSWDVLLQKSGAPGIHFQDYPQLQGFEQPEWSHLAYADAKRFTAALHAIVVRDFWKPAADTIAMAGTKVKPE
jgi:hypothetical protein